MARRVCVTGATGKAGRAAVLELRADLTDYGQATEVLRGADAVVHLANIPAPGRLTPAVTFNANVSMNFNVFHAAAALGLSKVTSETIAAHRRVRHAPGDRPCRAGPRLRARALLA